GSFGGYVTVASSPTSSYTDLTIVSGYCYHYRYVVSDLVGNAVTYASSAVAKVDAVAPSASLTDPGQYLSGTVAVLDASTDDGGSGLAQVVFQRSPAGEDSWTTMATVTAAPFTTSLDTTALTDGSYDLRVIATDRAGNA